MVEAYDALRFLSSRNIRLHAINAPKFGGRDLGERGLSADDVVRRHAHPVAPRRRIVPGAGDDLQIELSFVGRARFVTVADEEDAAALADLGDERAGQERAAF